VDRAWRLARQIRFRIRDYSRLVQAHDVAHFPIAVGGLTVLAADLVHDAEAVPTVGHVGMSHYQGARGSLGVVGLAGLDELDHHALQWVRRARGR
jgi:hypothetical protein